MFGKTWTDQPAVVEQAEPVASIRVGGARRVEIRAETAGSYLLTIGTLFGSQTLRCPDARAAFRMLGRAAELSEKRDVKPEKPPAGCVLLDETA